MLRITPYVSIDEEELTETFVRSSGPGGQHVNKTSTAVQLRFDAANSPALGEETKGRLLRLAGSLATDEGVIIIDARKFRSQKMNREDARERLADLIRSAMVRPKPRKPTRPSAAAKARRLETKKLHSEVKRLRSSGAEED